jgi:hypothetical protein
MDLIYTSAVLTLVAAAGSNPSYGLSGVSNARRVSYRATYIGDVRVFFAPDEVYRAVADSVWFTRGWTFQEGYVPRRRLYFTESGVLFICNEAEEQEDFHRCRHPWGAQLLDGTLGTRPFRVSDELSGLHETLGLLEQYMERQLSYENDALDAMLGVLNYHHARNPSIGTICGLPYQTSVAGPNTICLNWRHDKPATRRRGYPSWSPLGWIGSIQFFSPNHQFFPSKKDADILSHHFRDGCAAWNNFKTSKYLQIAVNVHNLPIVNLVRSDSETFEGMLSDHPRTVLVVPAGTGESKVDYGGLNYYMDVKWDATPPDHYDSTCVTCVVYHSHKDVQCLMIVQDCGTHYERLGFASSVGAFSTDTLKAAGFDELASTTNGLPTLRPRKSPNFYREHSHDSKDFDWLQDTEKVTITLG